MGEEQEMKDGKGEPKGVLAVWNDLDPKIETDYHEWYWQEHLLERLAVPGFLTARRYEGVGSGPKYFSFYLTTSVEVMRSPAYLQRMHDPTEWTLRCMASFRDMNRTACRQTIDLGRGVGSAAVTMEIEAAAGQEDSLRRKISDSLFPELLKSPGATGILRCQLWEGDPEITDQKSAEQAVRGGPDKMVSWVVVIEASSPGQAEKAGQRLSAYSFTQQGAGKIGPPHVYRLLHYLAGPDGR
jgi:hypothetical protein